MDAAVRSIEQNQGPVAADEARKAMIQASRPVKLKTAATAAAAASTEDK